MAISSYGDELNDDDLDDFDEDLDWVVLGT